LSFLGIDIGTSFVKGAVLDVNRRRFSHTKRIPFPDQISGLDSLRVEFDPDLIVRVIEEMIRRLSKEAGECEGLVMCSQMSSTVLLDEERAAVSNCVAWRDQRALMRHPSAQGRYFDVYHRQISAEQRRDLGNEMPAGAPACFLFWQLEQLERGARVTPVSLGSFVLSRLCNSAPVEDATNAMAFGLLDLTTLQWHDQVMKQVGLDRFEWPRIVPLGEIAGHMTLAGKPIPCYACLGDYQCALLGAMLEEGDLSINISTGSQVSMVTPKLELGNYQSRPFVDGQFTNTLSHLPAGRSLNVLVDLLTELGRESGAAMDDPWRRIAKAIESTTDTDLEVKLSFFPGPAGERGSISNISEKNLTVGKLFLAAFKDMAENYWSAAGLIWPDKTWKRIVLTGGLANKLPSLRRAIERRFEKETVLCDSVEETLCGLLLLAVTFNGRLTGLKEAMDLLRPEAGMLQETNTMLIGEST
jgi:sugar (pentulose or hexulose) kinase